MPYPHGPLGPFVGPPSLPLLSSSFLPPFLPPFLLRNPLPRTSPRVALAPTDPSFSIRRTAPEDPTAVFPRRRRPPSTDPPAVDALGLDPRGTPPALGRKGLRRPLAERGLR